MSEKVLAHPDQLPPREIQQQLQNLHTLYGARVLPDTVFTCLNGAPGSLDNFGSSLGDKDSVVARVTRELERLCMRSDDKLVTMRFWTFADLDKRAQHSWRTRPEIQSCAFGCCDRCNLPAQRLHHPCGRSIGSNAKELPSFRTLSRWLWGNVLS